MLSIKNLGLQNSYFETFECLFSDFFKESYNGKRKKKEVNFLKDTKERNLNNPYVSYMAT